MAPRVEPAFTLVGKPVRADESEMQRNPRARSAIMRVAERTRAAGVTS
jgi:16S rRNA (cytosine1402-N4)-methyltransferase